MIEQKHEALGMFAYTCGRTGRFDESRHTFEELIASATRVYGPEHETTTKAFMNRAEISQYIMGTAHELMAQGDRANGARYLDAVLTDSKNRDFFDKNDPCLQINCEVMAVAAVLLRVTDRLQECVTVARLCRKSAKERNDLAEELIQQCMRNFVIASCDLHGPTHENKEVLDELLALQMDLYGPDAPETQETKSICTAYVGHLLG